MVDSLTPKMRPSVRRWALRIPGMRIPGLNRRQHTRLSPGLVASLASLPLRLKDYEGGADEHNGETFGDTWALDSWSYQEAVAANAKLAWGHARAARVPVPMTGPPIWTGSMAGRGDEDDGRGLGLEKLVGIGWIWEDGEQLLGMYGSSFTNHQSNSTGSIKVPSIRFKL